MTPDEVMAAYASAWAEGDPTRAWSFYADYVVMRVPGRGALAGEHRGKDAVIACIQALLSRTSDLSVKVEVLDRLVSGERVALVVRETVVRDDVRVVFGRVGVYRVVKEKIVEIDLYDANQYEVDEFFG